MAEENLIKRVRAAAARHLEDRAVQKLIEKLDLTQQMAKSISKAGRQIYDPLAGYRAGSMGEDGYGLLLDYSQNLIDNSIFREAFVLHEVAVIVDCLVSILGSVHNESL